MGNSSYSFSDRAIRATKLNYANNTVEENFPQAVEKKAHDTMLPINAKLREARDSETHPNSIPIIFALDVTGSMLDIPMHIIAEGLPKLISGITEAGIPDPALLFLCIGDHTYDDYPLQVAQFESGDLELDTWLQRCYPEGGGGGNRGESYSLAWYYAANHTVTDNWEKRGKKGYLVTIGDEPILGSIDGPFIQRMLGLEETPKNASTDDLLKQVQEKWNILHIHIEHSMGSKGYTSAVKQTMGENLVIISDYKEIPKIVSGFVVKGEETSVNSSVEFPKEDLTIVKGDREYSRPFWDKPLDEKLGKI